MSGNLPRPSRKIGGVLVGARRQPPEARRPERPEEGRSCGMEALQGVDSLVGQGLTKGDYAAIVGSYL